MSYIEHDIEEHQAFEEQRQQRYRFIRYNHVFLSRVGEDFIRVFAQCALQPPRIRHYAVSLPICVMLLNLLHWMTSKPKYTVEQFQ